MPIARVRIAPMKHWCEYEKRKPSMFPEVDYAAFQRLTVEILTDSMKPTDMTWGCDGKVWEVTPKSIREIAALTGGECGNPTWFCEHMLELD